jgi:thioredoxin reductase (NADPH)
MNAGRPGLYAAGDIATYPGKVKLIAAGFGEVATAMEAVLRGRPIET